MIFGKRRQRIDAIADQVLNEQMDIPSRGMTYAHFASQEDGYGFLDWVGREHVAPELKKRVKDECGSLIAMLLWTIISAVIQAAIRRWLDKRAIGEWREAEC